MDRIYKLAKENLKTKYNINIDEKELDRIYVDFVRSSIREKHSNLLRDVFLPEFGSIKISMGKLERALKWAFRRRDKVKVPFYVKALRQLRKKSSEYWDSYNTNDKLKRLIRQQNEN